MGSSKSTRGPGRGPGEPRKTPLRTLGIVRWLQEEHSGGFTVQDVVLHYKMTRGEAYRRIQYMVVYQLVVPSELLPRGEKTPGRMARLYKLTPWGLKYDGRKGPVDRRAASR